MEATIENKLSDIRQLFRKYGAERAFIFGSAAKDNLTAESDVDLPGEASVATSWQSGEMKRSEFVNTRK